MPIRCTSVAASWPGDQVRALFWSADAAIERAEQEALEYAAAIDDAPDEYLEIAQTYQLFDVPEDGAEMFSLIRDSPLSPEDYLGTYCDTGAGHQRSTAE